MRWIFVDIFLGPQSEHGQDPVPGGPLHLELVAHAVHHPHPRQPGQGHQPQRLCLRESEGNLLQS